MTNNITNEQKAKALAIISNTNDSKLETHLNACVRCGLCASSCMYYLTMKEGKYIPARKVDLVSSIYRRYKTWQGAMFHASRRKSPNDTLQRKSKARV